MAQSGFTPISLYFSATGAAVPTAANLVAGELALNTNDGKLYFKNSAGVVTLLAGSTSGPAGGSTTQVQYNNSGVLAGITGATSNGTALTLVAPDLGSPSSVGTMPAFTLGGTVSGGGNQINNVIIGTSTPLAGAFTTLSATGLITGTQAGDAYFFKGVRTGGATIALYADSSLGYVGTSTNHNLSLMVNGTSYATLSSTGLAVTGTLSATGTLSGGTSGTAYSFSGSAPATSLTLTSGGDLGIGTSSPQNKLQVKATVRPQLSVSYDGTTGLYLEDSSNSFGKSWKIATSTAANSQLEFYQSTATSGVPVWAASAAMTLDASGNLMVGATSTSAIANKNIDVNGTGDAAFVIRVGGTTTSYLYSTAGQTLLGTVGAIPITFNTNGVEKVRITSGGVLDIGTGTGAVGQIQFPATAVPSANANTLDDYEEGTWTVQLQDGSNNNATMEAGFTTATYVKIGRQVTVNGTVYTSSVAGLSGDIKVSGLPFAVGNTNPFRCAGATSAEQLLNIATGQKLSIFMNPTVPTKFDIWISNSSTGGAVMTAAEWSNDGFAQFSLTYFTD